MLIVVTGGAASGKSALAEDIACTLAQGRPMLYVAAMEPFGEEAQRRIARHRALRAGKGFTTLEHSTRFDLLRPPSGFAAALFECASTALANEMFSPAGAGGDGGSILAGVQALTARCAHTVVVTNEVFSDGYAYDAGTAAYLHALGQLNQQLARQADAVAESVCGIPVWQKGEIELA